MLWRLGGHQQDQRRTIGTRRDGQCAHSAGITALGSRLRLNRHTGHACGAQVTGVSVVRQAPHRHNFCGQQVAVLDRPGMAFAGVKVLLLAAQALGGGIVGSGLYQVGIARGVRRKGGTIKGHSRCVSV
ncbi:MAG: hypothetical protein FD135_4769 [Comamonadaceae bacterium]|nr:MAG: hypothetical protein FD135_4769 [Comamonadaceae bacterium]